MFERWNVFCWCLLTIIHYSSIFAIVLGLRPDRHVNGLSVPAEPMGYLELIDSTIRLVILTKGTVVVLMTILRVGTLIEVVSYHCFMLSFCFCLGFVVILFRNMKRTGSNML